MMRSAIAPLALLLMVSISPTTIRSEEVDAIAGVKEAIQKAETERSASPKKNKGGYSEEQMKNILIAVEGYFAVPARKVLTTHLDFEPTYGEHVVVTERATKHPKGVIPIGDQRDVVKTEKKTAKPQTYSIQGGNVDPLRQIESVVFALQQAFKDTPLEQPGTRRAWPALKNIHSLMVELPKFSQRYLGMDGMAAAHYDDRAAQIEAMRKELVALYDELGKQMGELKKGDVKNPPETVAK